MLKNSIVVLSLAFASAALANHTYMDLAGNWEGHVTKNIKDTSAGGKPNMETEKTPAMIQLSDSKTFKGLEGKSTVGSDSESWTFDSDKKTYTWKDADMTVTSTLTSSVPDWVKKEVGYKSSDKIFVFSYSTCTLNKDKTPCKAKEHYPEGMDKTGHWVFKVTGDKMMTTVLYKYPSGKIRNLTEELNKKPQA